MLRGRDLGLRLRGIDGLARGAERLGHHHLGEGKLGAVERAGPRELGREAPQDRLRRRASPYDGLRRVATDPENAARIIGDHRIRARAVAEERGLAEGFSGTESLDLRIGELHHDFSREDDSHSLGWGARAEQFGSRSYLERDEERRDAGNVLGIETLEQGGAGEERFEARRRHPGDENALDGRSGGTRPRARLGPPVSPSRLDVRQSAPSVAFAGMEARAYQTL